MLNETSTISTTPKPAVALASPSSIDRSSSYPSRPPPALYSHYASPSPNAPLQSRSGPPLGPPRLYSQPSPQTQTQLSQENTPYNHKSYFSPSGSSHSREHSGQITALPQLGRQAPVMQKQHSEQWERERSPSVSPKTIPQPLLTRQARTESATPSLSTPVPSQKFETLSPQNYQNITPPESQTDQERSPTTPPPFSSSTTQRPLSIPTASSPVAKAATIVQQPGPTPFFRPGDGGTIQPRSKRSIPDAWLAPAQPPKRQRTEEIPIYARSARRGPLKLIKNATGTSVQPVGQIKRPLNGRLASSNAITPQQHAQTPGPPPQPSSKPTALFWEPSITNVLPYEDLTQHVSGWIYNTIGREDPLPDGAFFEIEAKIGTIYDIEGGRRLNLPVMTETVFDRNNFRRTRFDSSMDLAQHKSFNDFLNQCVQSSHQEPKRIHIEYDHRRESDEFYELNPNGVRALPSCVTKWPNQRHDTRVRMTTDLETLKRIASIIKVRIADLEIYNPTQDFDYRISISVESPWNGNNMDLIPLKEHDSERTKDRVSYRHMGYQIDLTQVSYPDGTKQQHELEVEISAEQLRLELANLSQQKPNRYEGLVKGFLDDVRILCRQGTIKGRK
jgi:hypothetical protein